MQHRLPEALRDRGWHIWNPAGGNPGAARLGGGAMFSALVCRESEGWVGRSDWWGRTVGVCPSMLEAIDRLETAEAQGFWSPLWRDAGPAPVRPGWRHQVRSGRDEWTAVTRAPHIVLSVMLVTLHVAPNAWGERPRKFHIVGDAGASESPIRFVVLVDGEPLAQCAGGQPSGFGDEVITPYLDPLFAMEAAECEAADRFAATGETLTLLDPLDAPAHLIRERA
jgi:hypothetical protein